VYTCVGAVRRNLKILANKNTDRYFENIIVIGDPNERHHVISILFFL